MANLLINAVKPSLNEQITKSRKAMPAAIAATIAQVTTWLPASVDKATAAFRTVYNDVQARIATWLPTTQPWLLATGNKALTWAKTKVDAL
jgi:hypothetical protein